MIKKILVKIGQNWSKFGVDLKTRFSPVVFVAFLIRFLIRFYGAGILKGWDIFWFVFLSCDAKSVV